MTKPIFQVDAFTTHPFGGNPAGVVLLKKEQPDLWMLSVAREMNLSETAFVIGEKRPYKLRWFTPAVEVNLCGHATLSAAHILYEREIVEKNVLVEFLTKSGMLSAAYIEGWIEMDFPSFTAEEVFFEDTIVRALKCKPAKMYYSGENIMAVFNDPKDIYNLCPDFNLMKQLDADGVIATSLSDQDRFDFISRYFAPKVGINEDPVTGSSHCSLGPYWGQILNKNILWAKQVSNRGGELMIRVESERTFIRGQAITIFSGTIHT
ncbi:MAG: PhzF family phenazine biosynthesis isomerase [Anaerolineaceae bacterium]|nr:PhzF family phenazine biosynthesis isomerase [Anaerolineaceae bacterium]